VSSWELSDGSATTVFVVVCVSASTCVTTLLSAASSLLPEGLDSIAPAEHHKVGGEGQGGHKWTSRWTQVGTSVK